MDWCRHWVANTERVLAKDASLYVWIGADQSEGFQPLPDFMVMMRGTEFRPRSFITMRNQRGYGTQKNWMAVRQELLYYVKGSPTFSVEAEYTDIPKILRGYYKVKGVRREGRGGLREGVSFYQAPMIQPEQMKNNQGFTSPPKLLLYRQSRNSARAPTRMAIGRPEGSRKIWKSSMFTMTGPSSVRPSGM